MCCWFFRRLYRVRCMSPAKPSNSRSVCLSSRSVCLSSVCLSSVCLSSRSVCLSSVCLSSRSVCLSSVFLSSRSVCLSSVCMSSRSVCRQDFIKIKKIYGFFSLYIFHKIRAQPKFGSVRILWMYLMILLCKSGKECPLYHYYTLGQSPWSMAMCLVWQSVLLGNGWNWSFFFC